MSVDFEGVPLFVGLADLQPGSSVLELGYGGSAKVAAVAKAVLGIAHGLIVVVEASYKSLLQGQRVLRYVGLQNDITLEFGDLMSLEAIPSLRASAGQSHPTFDVIYAKDVLVRMSDELRVPALRHWAKYLTPCTGRMVITNALGVEACLHSTEIAVINLNNLGDWYLTLDCERKAEKKSSGTLMSKEGVSLPVTYRVGFDAEGTARLKDIELVSNDDVAFTPSRILEEGSPDRR